MIYIVIFGAAVLSDGTASGTLRRRVESALATASDLRSGPDDDHVVFMPSGGIGKHAPAEAVVMADLLREAGVEADRIVQDQQSGDTLDTVVHTSAMIRRRGGGDVIACSSGYHLPRCLLLFRIAGVAARAGKVVGDAGHTRWRRLAWYRFREVPAIIVDVVLALWTFRR